MENYKNKMKILYEIRSKKTKRKNMIKKIKNILLWNILIIIMLIAIPFLFLLSFDIMFEITGGMKNVSIILAIALMILVITYSVLAVYLSQYWSGD
jgi:hypothetical protein